MLVTFPKLRETLKISGRSGHINAYISQGQVHGPERTDRSQKTMSGLRGHISVNIIVIGLQISELHNRRCDTFVLDNDIEKLNLPIL